MSRFTSDLLRAHRPHIVDHTQFEEVPAGWRSLVSDPVERIGALLDEKAGPHLIVLQIKPKSGSLRVHYRLDQHADDSDPLARAIADLVQDESRRSTTICDVCGRPGMLRQPDRRHVHVRCPIHA